MLSFKGSLYIIVAFHAFLSESNDRKNNTVGFNTFLGIPLLISGRNVLSPREGDAAITMFDGGKGACGIS